MKVRDMLSMLKADGWQFRNQEGSHRQFIHPTKRHPADEIALDTLESMMKQAGLKK